MQDDLLDFADEDSLAGFRLARFECYNWGTFDGRAWVIEPNGRNALLTGDIGSGKSTLVDGLTTLLFPSHRITYNKAAGAERQERSPYTYVRGAYGATQDEVSRQSRGRFLRDEKQYTVLLAHFYNAGFDRHVTLAQVWWLKPGERNPERLFIAAERRLSIAEDFGDFGGKIKQLRKRLRETEHVEIKDSFEQYAEHFRRLLGLESRQALELFYQTVSMKSVGDLTAFVRQHMLEEAAVDETLDQLLADFDNLNAAHDAVLKAQTQIERLQPIVELGERHQATSDEAEATRGDRDALAGWFAHTAHALLTEQVTELILDLDKRRERRDRLQTDLDRVRGQQDEVRLALSAAGGDRLKEIENAISRENETRRQRQAAADNYRKLSERLEFTVAANDDSFHRNRQSAQQALDSDDQEKAELDQARVDAAVQMQQTRKAHEELARDLEIIKARRSNIPRVQLEIRSALCEALDVGEQRLAFAGELIEVREDEAGWQGAIERVLHGFALSLLVPEDLSAQVARYVERTALGGRLVYFRVEAQTDTRLPQVAPESLVRKLTVKSDSEYYAWLTRELTRRFDYVCCDDLTRFQREKNALTAAGQMKSGGRRHEKDDRHALTDRSRYVLGWNIESKLQALSEQIRAAEQHIQQTGQKIAGIKQKLAQREQRRDDLRDLLRYTSYEKIHWQAAAREIQRLETEREQLRAASDQLRTLEQQLQAGKNRIVELQDQLNAQLGKIAQAEQSLEQAQGNIADAQSTLAALHPALREQHFPRLDARMLDTGDELTLKNLNLREREQRETLQAQIDALDKRLRAAADTLTARMTEFRRDYPAETTEFDASPQALGEYRDMLKRLQADDLPRHRQRFAELLREHTIQGLALLQNRLAEQEEAIGEKIDRINKSLRAVEYNTGTYISLQRERTQDVEIREFRQQLVGILESSFGEDDIYSEQRFYRVKTLVERFRGRDGTVEADARWTQKVTDVRNWFGFAASERWREDNSEKEFYPDSGGKSGGQKEKLAYTVLAASLAYQFGLEWGETRSRSFRFVVIDEAFGRGSDESTRYGLELFGKLNLQLLIVTPLQKVNVIEQYIHAVHFVYAEDNRSYLRNLTIEEYLEEKARRLG